VDGGGALSGAALRTTLVQFRRRRFCPSFSILMGFGVF
jgi:hypothetical protein